MSAIKQVSVVVCILVGSLACAYADPTVISNGHESAVMPSAAAVSKPSSAIASNSTQNFVSAWGVSAQVGTLGLGLNVAHALYSDYLNLRFQANFASLNTKFEADGAGNQANINWNTYGLLLDYMPFGGIFRLTGGLYYDDRSLNLTSSDIDIGGGYLGRGSAGIRFPKIAPYLGVGVGSSAASSLDKKGFLIAFDAGVLFQNPQAYANLTCSSSTSGSCAGFDSQEVQWQGDMQNAVDGFARFWPVISLSLGYRF